MSERPTVSDEQLVEKARGAAEGDLRPFEKLVDRHRGRVVANCRYLTRSADDAEDLAQEVFVKAFFGIGGFEQRASFKTWLQRIKINHCLNFLKRRQTGSTVDIEDPQLAGSEELKVEPAVRKRAETLDMRRRINAILDTMSDTLRVPLIMRDMDGLSYQEIADTLGVGLSAVKMRIKRARQEFREQYEAGEDDGDGETKRS